MAQWETTAYYAFGVPVYLSLVGLESLAARLRGHKLPSFAESVGNVGAGYGSIVVGLFLGPALVALYDWAHAHLALVSWAAGSWVPWVLAIVLADFGHYWHHRLDHRVAACWAVHGVHHQPEAMNFTVAMRHAWFSDLYSFPFYASLPLLGVPTAHFFFATTLLSVHALITHSSEYDFPSFFIFVTPRSHIVHHAKNPRYIDKNFGAMLCIWDKLFGTHVHLDPAEPPVYGTTHGYETHDGALSQWVLIRDLVGLARRARTLGDKLRVFVSRPGWTPPGVTLEPAPPARPSAAIPAGTKIYVGLQFVATIAASLYVFILRDEQTTGLKLGAAIAMVITLLTLGGLLDGRPGAARREGLRVVALALVGLVLLSIKP
jgi:sterol desaturase/sphingolipid hydroxylase (fatty acid hydroxylase superfamily)